MTNNDPTRVLNDAIRHEGGVSRRLFLAYAAALAATPLLAERARGQAIDKPVFASNPFTLGVASGDPDDQSVVLWTRLAPKPLEPDGGMSTDAIRVRWEIATDDAMNHIVRRGDAIASPDLAHSVHVEANGLEPDRWYFYRFRAGDVDSPVGRTRTLPLASASPDQLRFAFASCQHWEAGYYTAYDHMAKDELDLVFHLGDYIYEGPGKADSLRTHERGLLMTLDDYRIRHAQYRSDALLQSAHARCPWFVTWDDHELSNNYANEIDGKAGLTTAQFLARRAAAYKAYYEAMPLRAGSLPRGKDMQLYRKASFGNLAELLVLDTRQYRNDQPNDDKASPLNDAALDPSTSILGATQRGWLQDALTDSRATWNILAQQVMMGMIRRPRGMPVEEDTYSMDAWSGYARERIDFVQFMADRKVKNPVVLTGDVHANYVNDLRADDRQSDKPIVATEFVGTSISSGGDGVDAPRDLDRLLADNAGLHFHNRQRGYVRCTVDSDKWLSEYITLDQIRAPGGIATRRAAFVVENGQPGAKPA